MPDSKGELKRYEILGDGSIVESPDGTIMYSLDVLAALSTAEQRIEELGKVLAANQKAWADLFEQNIEQAATIAELRAEREKELLKALEFGAAWFVIALDRQEDGSIDMTRCIAAFLAQKEGK